MSKRVCSVPGCPALTDSGKCQTHRREADAARGRRQARGYGANHDRLRVQYQRRMDAGETFTCWRCAKPIDPADWHLGHDDHDRTITHGPEHSRQCNLSAAGRAAHGA